MKLNHLGLISVGNLEISDRSGSKPQYPEISTNVLSYLERESFSISKIIDVNFCSQKITTIYYGNMFTANKKCIMIIRTASFNGMKSLLTS